MPRAARSFVVTGRVWPRARARSSNATAAALRAATWPASPSRRRSAAKLRLRNSGGPSNSTGTATTRRSNSRASWPAGDSTPKPRRSSSATRIACTTVRSTCTWPGPYSRRLACPKKPGPCSPAPASCNRASTCSSPTSRPAACSSVASTWRATCTPACLSAFPRTSAITTSSQSFRRRRTMHTSGRCSGSSPNPRSRTTETCSCITQSARNSRISPAGTKPSSISGWPATPWPASRTTTWVTTRRSSTAS